MPQGYNTGDALSDNFLESLYSYLGEQSIYTTYGNTLSQALDQYANPVYQELLNSDGIYDGVGGSLIVDTPGLITVQYKGADVTSPYPNTQLLITSKQNHNVSPVQIKLVKLNVSLEITSSQTYLVKMFDENLNVIDVPVGELVKGHTYQVFFTGSVFMLAGYGETDITSRLNLLETHKTNVTSKISYSGGSLITSTPFQFNELVSIESVNINTINGDRLIADETNIRAVGNFNLLSADVDVKTINPEATGMEKRPINLELFNQEVDSKIDAAIEKKIIIDDRDPYTYEAEEGTLLSGTIYIQTGSQ